jgi:outer membrane protein TolC
LQRLALPADAVHWRSNEVVTKPDDPFAKLELTPEEIVRSAETRYPLLRSLRKRVQAAETRALGSGYGTRPAFYVEGRGTVSYFTKDIDESFYEGFDAPATAGHVPFIGYVGLGMSVPLGRSTFDAVAEQARISERIARADLNQALAIVAAGARQYAGTVSALRNAVGFRQTAFEAASAALAGAERSFALGQTTIFEVLRLQELRVQAEASLAVAQFDLKRASWNQARAAGMLSDVLPPEYKTGTN